MKSKLTKSNIKNIILFQNYTFEHTKALEKCYKSSSQEKMGYIQESKTETFT